MLRKTLTAMLAGAALALAAVPASAQELTIFWAEWDPANYLQELVNEYTAETGVQITVETTPWSDFQTKAFTEFNAKGGAYDMVVGDSQWLGAGATQGHYVDLTDFFAQHQVAEKMAPATVQYYSEYPAGSKKYWSVPLEATRPAGPIARTGSRTRRRRKRSRPNTATTRRSEDLQGTARHRRVLPPPGREQIRRGDLHRQLVRRSDHGHRERCVQLRRQPR
jgi:hypothetical protein